MKDCKCSCHEMIESLPGIFHQKSIHYSNGGKCYCEVDKDEAANKHQRH